MKSEFDDVFEEQWDSRKLGASLEHAEAVSDAYSAEVDALVSLQAISIRLPKTLMKDLKDIAARYEIGYQPMIRDLLNRFALAEQKKHLSDRLSQLNETENNLDKTGPVSEFISEIKKHSRG